MTKRLISGVALTCAFFGGASAFAADLDTYMPQPDKSFYVRGDVGIGRNTIGGFSQEDVIFNGGGFAETCCGSELFGDTNYISWGVGMELNEKFRIDATAEYRGSSQVKAMDYNSYIEDDPLSGVLGDTITTSTTYEGDHTAMVGLVNGYWDVTTWRGITPYLGAGVGMAYNQMRGFTTDSVATAVDNTDPDIPILDDMAVSHGYAGDDARFNLAYAFMAGVSYDIIPNAKLDLGYRYLNLGNDVAATTDMVNCHCGATGAPLELNDLSSHEIRVGVRWEFGYDKNENYSEMKIPSP